MKQNNLIATFLMFFFLLVGCQKDAEVSTVDVSMKMLTDKTWYLNHTKEGSVLRTYIGQPTYYITFLSNNTTADSDGITGNYSLSEVNNTLKLSVQAKTRNGSSINYSYNIVSLGSTNMVLSFIPADQNTVTTLYYSINQ